jgi:hypothetical protein
MPIPFTCPHCGKSMTVDDKFAGQTGPCASCQQPITIPSSRGAAPEGASSGSGWGTVLGVGAACLLGCGLCGGVIAVLLIPLGFRGMASANAATNNNLKQVVLALHNYHDTWGTFPPAVVNDADGKPLYSWRVLVLPFMEQAPLYDRFDRTKAWDDPANLSVSNTMLDVFRSPLDHELAPSGTSYFVIVGAHTAFPPDRPARIADITDGTSNTIAIVELKGIAGSWAAPIDPKLETIALSIGPSPGQLNPNRSGELNVALCDGSVRTLPASTPPQILTLMFTRDDGMPIPMPQ